MKSSTLSQTFLPELGIPDRGKVRDIYENDNGLTMIASDRISVFDRILPNAIPDKGRVLTELTQFWFEQTKDIVPNHIISNPDPNIMIVRKCIPLKVEVIVRGYLVGSVWRDYKAGKREKCGIPLPEGLQQNDPFPQPIITPTTKSLEGHDKDISKEGLIKSGIVTKDQWREMERISLELYTRGQEVAQKKGLVLVDTKYEFGLDIEGNLILIDEIHTPDSSRYWLQEDVERKQVRFPDKEFAREWATSQGFAGEGNAPNIPEEVQRKIREGYCEIFQMLTGKELEESSIPVRSRVLNNLKKEKMIKGVFALVIAGSDKDKSHVDKITESLANHGIPNKTVIASAHKQTHKLLKMIELHNESLEPMIMITVAGKSNALSGVVAANSKWPVIACPHFKDQADYLANIHSSIQLPNEVPVLTVVDPRNAGLAAAKILKTMEEAS